MELVERLEDDEYKRERLQGWGFMDTMHTHRGAVQVFPHVTPVAEGAEAFQLPSLPYRFHSLESTIDCETLQWHYDVHHRDCVEKLNKALREIPNEHRTSFNRSHFRSLEQILARISRFPKPMRAAAGGHWNHSFLWSVMTDRRNDREIAPDLVQAFEKSYGSLEDFFDYFVHAGTELSGSGWLWLLKTPAGRMKITTTPNDDNPLMDTCEAPGMPILACDLWEHAFHTRYKSNREQYLRAFLSTVNWTRVRELFDNGSRTDPFLLTSH